MATLTLPAQVESLESGMAFVKQCAIDAGASQTCLAKIELVAEEALSNICQHAYEVTVGTIEIHCWWHETQQFIIEVIDTGKPFNILDYHTPPLPDALEQRDLGGLGVRLLRAMADQVTYHRVGNHNVLRLSMSLVPAHLT